MSGPFSSFRIGIDGGGTSCRFALTMPGKRFDTVLGGANAHTDLNRSIAVLQEGLQALARDAGLSADDLRHIPTYAGLAGVTASATGAELAAALPLELVVVEDDRRSAVAGALGSGDGTVAGIGTGSFVVRQAGGRMRFLGGYGAVLGDEASGCWIGKQVLALALHCRDGLASPSPLTQQVWSRFDDTLDRMLKFARAAAPAEFADLAPAVIAAAQAGDVNGIDIMQRGAAYIADCLKALARPDDEPLCLIGGIGPHFAHYLPGPIAAHVRPPLGTPLDGALHLATTLTARNSEALHVD